MHLTHRVEPDPSKPAKLNVLFDSKTPCVVGELLPGKNTCKTYVTRGRTLSILLCSSLLFLPFYFLTVSRFSLLFLLLLLLLLLRFSRFFSSFYPSFPLCRPHAASLSLFVSFSSTLLVSLLLFVLSLACQHNSQDSHIVVTSVLVSVFFPEVSASVLAEDETLMKSASSKDMVLKIWHTKDGPVSDKPPARVSV